jgi:predicted transcriptional regulator
MNKHERWQIASKILRLGVHYTQQENQKARQLRIAFNAEILQHWDEAHKARRIAFEANAKMDTARDEIKALKEQLK